MGKPYRTTIDHSGFGHSADQPSANAPVAVGDSLVYHLRKYNALNGDDSDAFPGRTPSGVLDAINAKLAKNSNAYCERDVVLSGGATNDPDQIELIRQQIRTLKDAGATVVLIGVGPGPGDILKSKGVNLALKMIADDEHIGFAQAPESAFRKWDGKKGEHISREDNIVLYQGD